MKREKVIFIHDAAIDEYMSVLLLATMDQVKVEGIVIVNADCIAAPAMQVGQQIQQFIGSKVKLYLSSARGLNPFPWEYREDCVRLGETGSLTPYPIDPNWPPFPDGDAFLDKALDDAKAGELTLLITCPMTPLMMSLQKNPKRAKKIKRIIWMGGAINVPGNLDPQTLPESMANPFAEWNVFWDPAAVKYVFENTSMPIIMFPLDVTNQAAITEDFMDQLFANARGYSWSYLAYEAYALVATESFYDMWDVTATSYLINPDLFQTPQTMALDVITQGPNQGAIISCKGGREVSVVLDFADQAAFYNLVVERFARGTALNNP